MTNPNFAELKEKLCEFDILDSSDDFDEYVKQFPVVANNGYSRGITHSYWQTSARHQHTKSAAIISELIEIISLQNKEVESYARYIYCTENCKLSTSWSDHAKCTCGAEKLKNSVKAALSETTTRLQKLREKSNV